MKKIPLESTIVGSYKFLFQNIISIIGTMWLPLLLFIAIIGALLYGILPHQWLHCDFTPVPDPEGFVRARLPLIMAAIPVLMISGLLAGAMIRVGILRHAVGEKTSTTWVYVSLGARVWRMIAVVLLYFVVYIGVEIAAVAAIGLSHFALSAIPNIPPAVLGLVKALIMLAAFVVGIYIMVRLFFFLPAVVVAENKVGVARAWELGRGNVWRIIAVLVVIILPVVVIATTAFYATALATIVSVAVTMHEPKTEADVLNLLKSLLPLVPVLVGIWVVAAIALSGLVLGAIGKAYKAVTASDEVAG